jgi:hypothetical protein
MRHGGWGVVLAGGILNYAEMFEGPNFGSPENYGDGEAFPYLEIMFNFMQSLPYTRMAPRNDLVNAGVVCLAAPDSNYVCFAQTGGKVELNLSEATGTFTVEW